MSRMMRKVPRVMGGCYPEGGSTMDVQVRRAMSEMAYAFADVQQSLAQFEIEDQTAVAAQCARKLDMLSIRANEVKASLRESLRQRVREGAL